MMEYRSDRRRDVGRSSMQPVRQPSGGRGQTTTPAAPTWFWALLQGFRAWDQANPNSNPLYAYTWQEAYINNLTTPLPLGTGRAPYFRVGVAFDTSGNTGPTNVADLESPRDGTQLPFTMGATITLAITTVPVTNPSATSWGLLVGTTSGGSDIYINLSIPLGTWTINVPNIPADGSDFYVRFLTSGLNPVPFYSYRMNVNPTALAIHRQDMNHRAVECLAGPACGYAQGTDPWQPLDDILVRMHETKVGDDTTYVFDQEPIEYWGRRVQAPSGETEYADGRYWFELQQLIASTNDWRDPITFNVRTSPKNQVVLVHNITENHLTTQSLPYNQIARIHMTRGGTYPHVPRYWCEVGGPSGAGGFSGTIRVVHDICFDAQGCVSEFRWTEVIVTNGLITSLDPWPQVFCP